MCPIASSCVSSGGQFLQSVSQPSSQFEVRIGDLGKQGVDNNTEGAAKLSVIQRANQRGSNRRSGLGRKLVHAAAPIGGGPMAQAGEGENVIPDTADHV